MARPILLLSAGSAALVGSVVLHGTESDASQSGNRGKVGMVECSCSLWSHPSGYIPKHGAMAYSLDEHQLAQVSRCRRDGNRVGLDPPVHTYRSPLRYTGVRPCLGKRDGAAFSSSKGRTSSKASARCETGGFPFHPMITFSIRQLVTGAM